MSSQDRKSNRNTGNPFYMHQTQKQSLKVLMPSHDFSSGTWDLTWTIKEAIHNEVFYQRDIPGSMDQGSLEIFGKSGLKSLEISSIPTLSLSPNKLLSLLFSWLGSANHGQFFLSSRHKTVLVQTTSVTRYYKAAKEITQYSAR